MYRTAAKWIKEADAIVVAAGAGMGVDSGLPDFRGPEGFWRAYPPYRALGLRFEDIANPRWFREDPALAWGFYGHRLALYRETMPHAGFRAILDLDKPTAVFTSNVDGQFQKAGFETVYECHGSIHWNQCPCGPPFPATPVKVNAEFRATPPFPTCPRCGRLARPAILMFGDGEWDSTISDAQAERLQAFMRDKRILVLEIGAGTAVPSVRRFAEQFKFIRINVRESRGAPLSIPVAAKEVLCEITKAMSTS